MLIVASCTLLCFLDGVVALAHGEWLLGGLLTLLVGRFLTGDGGVDVDAGSRHVGGQGVLDLHRAVVQLGVIVLLDGRCCRRCLHVDEGG